MSMNHKQQIIFDHYRDKLLNEIKDVAGDEIESSVGITWDSLSELLEEYLTGVVEDLGRPAPSYKYIYARVIEEFQFFNPEIARKLRKLLKEYELHIVSESEIESGVEVAHKIYPEIDLEIPPRFSKK